MEFSVTVQVPGLIRVTRCASEVDCTVPVRSIAGALIHPPRRRFEAPGPGVGLTFAVDIDITPPHRHYPTMGSSGAILTCFLVICIAAGVSGSLEDGLPRPKNFPDLPTVAYGPTPVLSDESGSPVACEWYGFANSLFTAETGTQCLTVLRKALTNATVNPPEQMRPYLYYTLNRLMDDQNNSYCYQGCFNLGASAPPPLDAPLPSAPTPAVATPPLSITPPPMEPEVPSSTPFGSPPLEGEAPAEVPSSTPFGSPPLEVEAPAEVPTGLTPAPMASDAPMTIPPPPIATPSLGAGAFLRPSGLLSGFVAVAGVALALGVAF